MRTHRTREETVLETTADGASTAREPVLNPVDRVSEFLFGRYMALTFVGAVSIAHAGRSEIRAMFAAALGCNLAWGLADAVTYVVRTIAERGRSLTLVRSVRAAADAASGCRLMEQSFEAIRGRIVALPSVPDRPRLQAADLLAALAVVAVAPPAAAAEAGSPAAPAWELALTAYPTDVRGGENYTSAIATANRGALHLELRVNYESIGARSAFVGWNIAGGETVTWKLTPLLGGAWGTTQAFVPGVEASLGWRALDYYIEAEYVRTREGRDDSYMYAWSELGWSAGDWLRLGLVAQRTRAYESDRDLQRGPFVQLKWKPVTIGAYWFNPGSTEQVLVGMVALSW